MSLETILKIYLPKDLNNKKNKKIKKNKKKIKKSNKSKKMLCVNREYI
tara:strand:+ start:371 stop:514 length:144 start_codon:yes stop_codon:yes gene_type:complete